MSEEIMDHLVGHVSRTVEGAAIGVRKKALASAGKVVAGAAAAGASTIRQLAARVNSAKAAAQAGPAAPAANTPQLSKSPARKAQQQQQATPAAASQPAPAPRHTPVVGQPLSPRQERAREKWLAAGSGS